MPSELETLRQQVEAEKQKQELARLLEDVGAEWPVYVKEWHKQNMSISTTMRPTVADVMCNVNQP